MKNLGRALLRRWWCDWLGLICSFPGICPLRTFDIYIYIRCRVSRWRAQRGVSHTYCQALVFAVGWHGAGIRGSRFEVEKSPERVCVCEWKNDREVFITQNGNVGCRIHPCSLWQRQFLRECRSSTGMSPSAHSLDGEGNNLHSGGGGGGVWSRIVLRRFRVRSHV